MLLVKKRKAAGSRDPQPRVAQTSARQEIAIIIMIICVYIYIYINDNDNIDAYDDNNDEP